MGQDRNCPRLRFSTAAASRTRCTPLAIARLETGSVPPSTMRSLMKTWQFASVPGGGDRDAPERRRRHLHDAALDEVDAEILIEEIAIRAQAERAHA